MARDRLILQAAQQLFYERGFGAVGMDEIGQQAGVTGPAIYRHFKGKDEILSTLFDEALDVVLVKVASRKLDDPADDLRFLAEAHVSFAIEHYQLAGILVRDERSLAPMYRRRHQRREGPYVERWRGDIEKLCPSRSHEEAVSVSFAMLSMLSSVGTWPSSARKNPGLPEIMANLVIGGLQAFEAGNG